jgi:DNA-binding transcriptional MocR family regulator
MSSLSARSVAALLGDWRGAGGSPAYVALADRIRLLVLDGRMPIGARLAAERELAEQLHVSRTTVTAAYARLREDGYLESVRGSGSVAKLPGRLPVVEMPAAGLVDFSKAAMPASPFLADAAVRAASRLPAHLGSPGFDLLGMPELRASIAERYARRGLPTEPEQIMVTVGAQHAIALLARVLLSRGDRALVETPGYLHSFEALRSAGARLVTVPVSSEEGWDEELVEQVLRQSNPSLGYLMPDFHNPTGRSMPPAQRERILAMAARNGTVLVADETMGELSIDRGWETLPFAAYDGTKQTVTIGSVGKTVWGGVRIGWIRAERSVIQRLVRARSAGDLGTPALEQLIVLDLLERYDDVLEERRTLLRAGRAHLEDALRREFPHWTVPHVDGGLTAWVGLGAPVSSALTLQARANGLLIAAGPRFGIDGAFERFLRIPFSLAPAETDAGLAALRLAWSQVSNAPVLDQQDYAEVV